MLTVHYFASIREKLALDSEQLEVPEHIDSVTALVDYLISLHGSAWEAVLKNASVLVAVNQSVADYSSLLRDGDEVAFFPPVTGG